MPVDLPVSDEQLVVAFRGNRELIAEATLLCESYHGDVAYREGDVLVVEVTDAPEILNRLIANLPNPGVTHLWRSGEPVAAPPSTLSCVH